jgi:hypothetical protein
VLTQINIQELEDRVNGKKARAIRKASELNEKMNLREPDYRVSKEKKKVVYESTLEEGLVVTKARTIKMQSIVNLNKLQYRNFKKVFNEMPRPLRSVIQENPKQEQE